VFPVKSFLAMDPHMSFYARRHQLTSWLNANLILMLA
jgi:hypothetical protein